MSPLRHSPSRRRRRLLVALVASLGVLLSLVAHRALTVKDRRLIEAQLRTDAEQMAWAVERQFRHAVTTIYSLSVSASPARPANPDEFLRLAERILEHNRDLSGVYWLPRVKPEERGPHEQAARQQVAADYQVRQWAGLGVQGPPRTAADEDLLPILFAAPSNQDLPSVLGLDLLTVPDLQAPLSEAILSGQVAVSEPVAWGAGQQQHQVFFAFRGLYARDSPAEPAGASAEQLRGVVAMAIRVEAVIANPLARFPRNIDVRLFGQSEGVGRHPVCEYDSKTDTIQYATEPVPDDSGTVAAWVPPIALEVPGHQWSVECQAATGYFDRRSSPLALVSLCFGLLLTGVLSTYANTLLGRTEKIARLVIQRTAELDYERFLLDTLLKYSPDYIYFKDPAGRFLRISRALAAHFRVSDPATVLGKTDFDFYEAERARGYQADEQQVMRTGQPLVDHEEEQTRPDGRVEWVSTTKVPLRSADGAIMGTFGISRDITLRKKAEEAQRIAREAAEAANRAKSDFLANMSHEIRTPLNAVIGMTELLLETDVSASQREYLKMVLESGESLLSVIDDILDFSKIEAGKMTLQDAEFDLRDDLGDALKSLAFRAHRKGLELICAVEPDVPDRLVGDLGRLRQIIVNLVGNAIKFTDCGEVVVRLSCAASTEHETMLQVAVSDTGIGIPEDQRQRIFEAFEQVDMSRTRRFGGTGLGLTICSRLVGFLGGRLWLESTVGRGSTFCFTARFRAAGAGEPPSTPSTPPVAVQQTRVLIVDDNQTSRRLMEEMAANWRLRPTTVPDAVQALAVLRTAQQEGQPYPLVIVDAEMPGVDGFALVHQITADHRLAARIIMMLTSGDRLGEIARCEELGVAAYLLKPIKQSELFDAIILALGVTAADEEPETRPPARPTPPAPPRLPPLRVLVVEDSLVNQKLALGLLERHGHQVAIANHGREALAAIESHPFDVVLMDVQMPEMDGIEATVAIRARERLTGQHLPIIAMTAHAMKGARERCLEAGMDAYVSKPIRTQHVLDTIAAVLQANPASTTPERPASERT